ncbi:MAG: membrane protein insertase YidC [Solirubrobacterales bacterium]|nr:membrane protein insertase YidC [Solirubrobacterales bacterium]MCB8971682.1 membrane protein insertase YidC [Thermoleophilales bacterium]MCO5326665.1 YidC/Oxa1 family membrane protein insertase [Solirubrobacterales bacterium]
MNIPVASIFTEIPEAIIVFFHDTVGLGWGPSIVALVFTVRLAILPISLKQIKSMRAMSELAPHIKAIQEKYKNDKQRQQQEMMRFYQENEINPLASCLPLLLQLPVFISLYYMLKGESFQQDVENAPPEGWLFINSLIEPPDPTWVTVTLIVLFIVTQLAAGLAMTVRGQGIEGPQRFIVFGLPFLFAPFVASFEAGLSVYWISTNIWTFMQQQLVYSMMGPMKKPTEEELAETTKAPPPPPRRKKKKSGRRR